MNDPNCLNAENSAGKTPYVLVKYPIYPIFRLYFRFELSCFDHIKDLLQKNVDVDSSTKDKCLRLLKPGANAAEVGFPFRIILHSKLGISAVVYISFDIMLTRVKRTDLFVQ